jgi:glycosyltransferase involved in cell wall biosynthesis
MTQICLLEEGLDRALPWAMITGIPSPLRQWLVLGEQLRVRHTYRRLARAGVYATAISDGEASHFSRYFTRDHIVLLPHSIDCDFFVPIEVAEDIDIAMFGDFSQKRVYEPAIQFFGALKESMPALHGRLKWAFVGQKPHALVRELEGPQVLVTGYVPDIRPYYGRTRLVVVPSVHGTGSKTTLLQAWAMSRCVVSTPEAVRGLPARDGGNAVLAHTPAQLIEAASVLLDSPERRAQLGMEGRRTVMRERNVEHMAAHFASFCQDLMSH